MNETITMSAGGKIILPEWVMADLQISAGDKVEFLTDGDGIFIKKLG